VKKYLEVVVIVMDSLVVVTENHFNFHIQGNQIVVIVKYIHPVVIHTAFDSCYFVDYIGN